MSSRSRDARFMMTLVTMIGHHDHDARHRGGEEERRGRDAQDQADDDVGDGWRDENAVHAPEATRAQA